MAPKHNDDGRVLPNVAVEIENGCKTAPLQANELLSRALQQSKYVDVNCDEAKPLPWTVDFSNELSAGFKIVNATASMTNVANVSASSVVVKSSWLGARGGFSIFFFSSR